MHIPENYLSPSTCAVLGVCMVGIWCHGAKKVDGEVSREEMPLLGVAGALCFLAMMFNVPVFGGTTGHAVCGTLIAILFGPWPAVMAISVALAIQAVLFGDGGILALGANCLNIAFVLPMVGYGVYLLIRGKSENPPLRRELLAAAAGSYVGINAAALCAALELGLQPLLFTDGAGQALYFPYPPSISVPAMLLAHLTVCGAAEVVFTVGILAYVRKVAPSFGAVREGGTAGAERASGVRAMAILVAILVVLVPVGLLAEGDAWGEWSAEDLAAAVGYAPRGLSQGWEWSSLLPDYSWGGLPGWLGYVLSAAIGVALVVIVFRLLGTMKRPGTRFD